MLWSLCQASEFDGGGLAILDGFTINEIAVVVVEYKDVLLLHFEH